MFRPSRSLLMIGFALITPAVVSPANAFAMHPQSGGSTQAATTSVLSEHTTTKALDALGIEPFISLQEAQVIQLDTVQVSSPVVQGVINKVNAAARNGVSFGAS